MSFIIILGAVIFLLCAISICLLIQPSQTKLFNKKHLRRNRYSVKRQERAEPRLGSNPLNHYSDKRPKAQIMQGHDQIVEPCDDTDSVLGLEEVVKKEAEVKIAKKSHSDLPERIIVFHLCAEPGMRYEGYELLQALLTAGMRFGDMDIFHRHEKKTGEGSVLFSLASMTKPGTFDMSQMGAFSTQGLTLFLTVNAKLKDPIKAFQMLLNTIDQLVEDLGGKVFDESHQLLSKEKVMELFGEINEIVKDRRNTDLYV